MNQTDVIHPPDESLLATVHGQPIRDVHEAESHLANCNACRARAQQLSDDDNAVALLLKDLDHHVPVMDLTETLSRQRAHRVRVRHVGRDHERVARRRIRAADRLAQSVAATAGQRDAIPGPQKRLGHGPSDAGAGARDDRDTLDHIHGVDGLTVRGQPGCWSAETLPPRPLRATSAQR